MEQFFSIQIKSIQLTHPAVLFGLQLQHGQIINFLFNANSYGTTLHIVTRFVLSNFFCCFFSAFWHALFVSNFNYPLNAQNLLGHFFHLLQKQKSSKTIMNGWPVGIRSCILIFICENAWDRARPESKLSFQSIRA